MGGVVVVADVAAVRLGDLDQVADGIIVVAGGAGGDTVTEALLGKAAPGVITQGGDEAVRIDEGQGAADAIMFRDLGDLAQGVGNAGTVAVCIIAVGGDVGHIESGAVDGLDLAHGVVGVAGGAIGKGKSR